MNALPLSTITVRLPLAVANGIATLGKSAGASQAMMAQTLLVAAYSSKVKPGDDATLDAAVASADVDAEKRAVALAKQVAMLNVQAGADKKAIAARDSVIEGLREGRAAAEATAAAQLREVGLPVDRVAFGAAPALMEANEKLELEVATLKAVIADGQKAIDDAQRDTERWRAEAKEQGQQAATLAEKHEAYRNEAHARLERAAAGEQAAREEVDVLKAQVEALKKAAKDRPAAPLADATPHPCTDIIVRLVALHDTAAIAAATDLAESSIANMIALWRDSLRARGGALNGTRTG